MPKISAANLADHRAHTLNALLDAIDELVVEREYESLSLSEIAARAGVSRTAVYNYAADKSSLLAAARLRATAEVRAATGEMAKRSDLPGAARLGSIVDLLLSELAESPRQLLRARALHLGMSASERTDSIAEFSGEVQNHLAVVIAQGQRDGSIDSDRDPVLDSEFVVGVLEVAVTRFLLRPEAARDVSVRAVDFIHRGVGLR